MTKKPEESSTELDDYLTGAGKTPPQKAVADTPPELPKAPEAKPEETKAKKYIRKGRLGGFKYPASLPLSKEMMPPITRRRMAIYELLNKDAQDPRVIEGPRIVEIPPFQMHPIYQVYDRFEEDLGKRMRTMIYSNEIKLDEYMTKQAKGQNPMVDMKTDMPEFINGQVLIDCESQFVKYVWWELHPENESNKFRDKTKPPRFKRVDQTYSSPHLQLIRMDLARDAENYVIKLPADKLINLATAFGIPSSVAISDMRLDLRKRAHSDPEGVLFKAPDSKATAMMSSMSALDLGVIDYHPEKQEYFFPQEQEPFFIVPLDQNPLEALGKFLISEEGKEVNDELMSLLSFWK